MALFGTDLQLHFPDGLRWFGLDLREEGFGIVQIIASQNEPRRQLFFAAMDLLLSSLMRDRSREEQE
jgi:hypothetical protein